MSKTAQSPRVIIIGAGMSGICMGIQLLREGFRSITIPEVAKEARQLYLFQRTPPWVDLREFHLWLSTRVGTWL